MPCIPMVLLPVPLLRKTVIPVSRSAFSLAAERIINQQKIYSSNEKPHGNRGAFFFSEPADDDILSLEPASDKCFICFTLIYCPLPASHCHKMSNPGHYHQHHEKEDKGRNAE